MSDLKPIVGPGYNPRTGQIEENADERRNPVQAGGWFITQAKQAAREAHEAQELHREVVELFQQLIVINRQCGIIAKRLRHIRGIDD